MGGRRPAVGEELLSAASRQLEEGRLFVCADPAPAAPALPFVPRGSLSRWCNVLTIPCTWQAGRGATPLAVVHRGVPDTVSACRGVSRPERPYSLHRCSTRSAEVGKAGPAPVLLGTAHHLGTCWRWKEGEARRAQAKVDVSHGGTLKQGRSAKGSCRALARPLPCSSVLSRGGAWSGAGQRGVFSCALVAASRARGPHPTSHGLPAARAVIPLAAHRQNLALRARCEASAGLTTQAGEAASARRGPPACRTRTGERRQWPRRAPPPGGAAPLRMGDSAGGHHVHHAAPSWPTPRSQCAHTARRTHRSCARPRHQPRPSWWRACPCGCTTPQPLRACMGPRAGARPDLIARRAVMWFGEHPLCSQPPSPER